MAKRTMRIHESITPERIMEAIENAFTTLDNPGFCIICGVDADGCEPDARGHQCESCGAPAVYGAEELLIRVA